MKQIIKDRIALASLIIGLALNIIIWLLLILKIKPTDLPISLHYNVYFGVDIIDKYTKAYIIPVAGLIMLAVNLFLSAQIYPKSKIAAKMLIFVIPIVQFLLLVGAGTVVMFNL